MDPQLKIATCCYCGKRTSLRLSARDGHELACGSCGAPLHEMKSIKVKPVVEEHPQAKRSKVKKTKTKQAKPIEKSFKIVSKSFKRQLSNRIARKVVKEVFDIFEDIFD